MEYLGESAPDCWTPKEFAMLARIPEAGVEEDMLEADPEDMILFDEFGVRR